MATSSGGQPPGAGPPIPSSPTQKEGLTSPTLSATIKGPGLKTMADAVKSGSRGPANMRSFAEIMEQEKRNRNILEIKTVKTRSEEAPPPDLKAEDIGELLFDILHVNHADCLAYDYNTGRYDTKQIKLKPGIPVTNILAKSPLNFKGHTVTVTQQRLNITRVTFKNVPLNVPDEEIIHLCMAYGKPVENKVHYEVLHNPKNKGHTGSTRFVDMELNEGKSFNNYYWLEGPLSGDEGRRVLVLHSGQAQQCSNCLENAPICPASGNGKLCREMNIPRARMSDYTLRLKIKVGYISLKTQYLEMQSGLFPRLGGGTVPSYSNEMDKMDALQTDLVPINPIEERDMKISGLQESLTLSAASIEEKDSAIADLKKQLDNALSTTNATEMKKLKRELSTAQKKVEKAYSGSAKKLLTAVKDVKIPLDEEFDSTCALLASSFFDTPLTEEDINKMNTESAPTDTTNDVFKPFRADATNFDSVQFERFGRMRNKVVESLRLSVESRRQSLSLSPARRKRGKDREEDNLQPAKMVNDRSSPPKDTVPRSKLPSLSSKK